MERRYPNIFKLRVAGTLIFLICTLSASALSQIVNGAFHGTVTDPSGAVIPGAKIVIENLTNAQTRVAITDSHGFYTITQEPPGHYSISVSKSGFVTAVQSDVELLVNQDLSANYTLKVGQVTQHVQVTAAPPMLSTTNATLGQVIGTRQTVDLPLNGRQFTQLILLTPGAAPKEGGQQSFYVIPIGGGEISPAVNGSETTENTFTLDGILNNHFFYQEAAISPPPDAIQEFNAQYHATDAQFGISSGADVNVVTKTGGPQIHGDAWEFLRNSGLDSANFFDNYANEIKPPYRQNQYGATIGGPVILPGYDGRKKHTYFFGYWEGFRSVESFTEFANVPTREELNGDFGDILTTTPSGSTDDLGRPIIEGAIYNPYSSREVTAGQVDPVTGVVATATGLVRDPFPGNIIPASMLTSQALIYDHAFYPSPNYGPGGNSFPNFVGVERQPTSSDQFGVSLDHTFANNDSLVGNFFFQQPNEVVPTPLLQGATDVANHGRMATVGYTHIFSPTAVLTAHFGYQWLDSYYNEGGEGAGLALLDATGYAPIEEEQNGEQLVPELSLSPRISGTSQYAIPQGPMRTHELNVDFQKIHGSHTFGAGLLYMQIQGYDNGWGASVAFDEYPSSAISSTGANVTSTGDGLASQLLNLPSSDAETAGVTGANVTENWYGGYLQDKWQATRKLSLTVGVRWDFASPPHYLHNQFSAWNGGCWPKEQFSPDASAEEITTEEDECILMPVIWTQYPTASNPYPVSWKAPNVRSTLWDPKYNGWQPRFGFAYAVKPRTVIRGGFVVYDDHNQFDKQIQGSRGSWPFGIPSGEANLYSAENRGIPNPDFLANNLPSAISLLEGTEPFPSVSDDISAPIGYSMEYNFGIEQQITPNMALTVNYVGLESRHLWACCESYNQPLPNKMGPNAFPDGLPFPFLGVTLAGETNSFNGDYNGLQVKLQKRFSHGLGILTSYTWSKSMDESSGDYGAGPQNYYDMRGAYGPSDYNFPQIFSFAPIYQLPFGKGRHFASNAGRGLDALIGGWNVSDITSALSGAPFTVFDPIDIANAGTSQYANIVPGCNLTPAGYQNVHHWYNTSCFAEQPEYTFGDSSRNAFRGPNYLDFDVSLFKNFSLTESKTLQFRGDFFNLFNRPNFSAPGGGAVGAYAAGGGSVGTEVDTPTFMEILSAAPAREIQFSLKFIF
jgi:hypothetical protein